MTTKTMDRFLKIVDYKTKQQVCSQCNAHMTIVDQFEENDVLFTWYECTRTDCDGQWLWKKI